LTGSEVGSLVMLVIGSSPPPIDSLKMPPVNAPREFFDHA
jgi:hypothetical protein